MEIDSEHQSREPSSIGNVEEKNPKCIYRLPQYICKVNKAAYAPRVISIGPLHYGNKELMKLESQKTTYLTRFEKRVAPQVLEEFKTYILNKEQSIRAHYSVPSDRQSCDYADIIFRDAIFIMELFLRKHNNTEDIESPAEDLESPTVSYMTVDLLLLENQLPYFVLDYLYSKISYRLSSHPSFLKLFLNFFEGYQFFKYVSLAEIPKQFTHFIDFLRCALVMRAKPALESGDNHIVSLPCATKLQKSGLKFKATKDKSLLDIQFAEPKKYGKWLRCFEANELQIPTLEINDDTEILLRNLMAWEMFHHPAETHICNYAALMDQLINTKEDVDLFVEKGIIVNSLGENKAIAKMFNRLCNRIVSSPSCYYGISRKMIDHYKHPWYQAKMFTNEAVATLKRVYFNNPWKGTATVAAIFLLIFILTQTICSIVQVHQGHTK